MSALYQTQLTSRCAVMAEGHGEAKGSRDFATVTMLPRLFPYVLVPKLNVERRLAPSHRVWPAQHPVPWSRP
jgi:hypothetical protein